MTKVSRNSRLFRTDDIRQEAFVYYRRLHRLQRYVSRNLAEPISLETAAGVANLEKTYFSRYFHAKTGVCFHDWLTSVRVDKAKAALRQGNRTISGTAWLVGFNSLRTFERAFEKHAGSTPREYQKTVRPESQRQ